MTDGRAWQGKWKARLYERVRERGYDSLTAFAEARPAVPLVELAEELGKEDVAGVQVLSGLLAEAEQRKQVTRFVRDVLVRQLSQSLPNGWPVVMDEESRFQVASTKRVPVSPAASSASLISSETTRATRQPQGRKTRASPTLRSALMVFTGSHEKKSVRVFAVSCPRTPSHVVSSVWSLFSHPCAALLQTRLHASRR